MTKHETLVILSSGERLLVAYEDEQGVHTDAGCHPWSNCVGWLCWHPESRRYMVIPR